MIGPVFYAIKVADRDDGCTVYMSATMGPSGYKRETLDEAARFMRKEDAEIQLEASLEIGPEIVALHSVKLAGNWRGWHATLEDGRDTLNGPYGQTVRKRIDGFKGPRNIRFPWEAHWPDGTALLDPHDRIRSFAAPMAARNAIERAMHDEHLRQIPENRMNR